MATDGEAVVVASNAYWDAVKGRLAYNPLWQKVVVDCCGPRRWTPPGPPGPEPLTLDDRNRMILQWSCTITDPLTVAFVAEHLGGRAMDPLTGSGWWPSLLAIQHGLDVFASDEDPGRTVEAAHAGLAPAIHYPIAAMDAVDAVTRHAHHRTLLLCWPPQGPLGGQIVTAYPGNRVVFVGIPDDTCGDALGILARDWTAVDGHEPAQWGGMEDVVLVYDRA